MDLTLLIDTSGSLTHLQTDQYATLFVGHKSRGVQSKEDASKIIRAFADLHSYTIVQTAPAFSDTGLLR